MAEPSPAAGEPRSLGVVGGTFNPPHLGHLAIARRAREQLNLARVVLMPARVPPHKPIERDPGCEHRLAMCRLLVRGAEGVSVCALETERDGPSYTVDTLSEIHASHPRTELTLVAGADIAGTLATWREPRRLLELASLAVATRGGADRRSLREPLAALGAGDGSAGNSASGDGEVAGVRVSFLDMQEIDVSSSLVRERAAAGEPIGELVGDAVAGYIAEHGLYGARARAAS